MRITNSMLNRNYLSNLNTSMGRLSDLQMQLSTGKKLVRISDDPASMISSMNARSRIARLNQYSRNTQAAKDWLNQGEVAIREVNELIKSVYEKTIDATTDVKAAFVEYQDEYGNIVKKELAPERVAFTEYVKQMRDQLVQAANVTLEDKYIFSGFNGPKAPFVVKDVCPPNMPAGYQGVNGKGSVTGGTGINAGNSVLNLTEQTDKHNGKSYSLNFTGDYFVLTNSADPTESYKVGYRPEDISSGDTITLDFQGLGKLDIDIASAINGNTADYQAAFDSIVVTIDNTGQAARDYPGVKPNVTTNVPPGGNYDFSFKAEATDENNNKNFDLIYNGSEFVLTNSADPDETYRVPYTAKDLDSGHKIILNFEGLGSLQIDVDQGITSENFANDFNFPGILSFDNTGEKPIDIEKDVLFYNGIRMDTPAYSNDWDLENEQVMEFWTGYGVKTPVSVLGCDLLNKGEDNIYKIFDDLYKDLKSGKSAEDLKHHITKLQEAQNNILSSITEYGSRINRLDMVLDRYEEDGLNYIEMLSNVEDADLAEVMMHFQMANAVYQMALKTGPYVIQPTLIDFLR